MIKTIVLLITLTGGWAQAQNNSGLEERVRVLEQRIRQMQNTMVGMDNRLRNLEYNYGGQPPIVSPEPTVTYSAILVDSSVARTFLGTGNTKLQAEANARQACAQDVHQSYCNGSVRFGEAPVGSKGWFCMVTDASQGKTFSGEGPDSVYAEAKAKQACQETVHSSYCGKVKARCEGVQ